VRSCVCEREGWGEEGTCVVKLTMHANGFIRVCHMVIYATPHPPPHSIFQWQTHAISLFSSLSLVSILFAKQVGHMNGSGVHS